MTVINPQSPTTTPAATGRRAPRTRINRADSIKLAGWLGTIKDKSFASWDDACRAATAFLGLSETIPQTTVVGTLRAIGRDVKNFVPRKPYTPRVAPQAPVGNPEVGELILAEIHALRDTIKELSDKLDAVIKTWQ